MTSRMDGVLEVTINPYKMALAGEMVERNKIIMKKLNRQAEPVADRICQLTMSAGAVISKLFSDTKQPEKKEAEDEDDTFYHDECPTEEDVSEKAEEFGKMITFQRDISITEFKDEFEKLVKIGLIRLEGDYKMQPNVWDRIDRKDRNKLMLAYIVFFVDPLENAQTQKSKSKATLKKHIPGDTK